jgi:hypothetical protein
LSLFVEFDLIDLFGKLSELVLLVVPFLLILLDLGLPQDLFMAVLLLSLEFRLLVEGHEVLEFAVLNTYKITLSMKAFMT